jgi:hypothetical protein
MSRRRPGLVVGDCVQNPVNECFYGDISPTITHATSQTPESATTCTIDKPWEVPQYYRHGSGTLGSGRNLFAA